MHTLIDVNAELAGSLLGRLPAALVLVVLTLMARNVMGTTRALLGLSGFCAGAAAGTALLPSILGAFAGGAIGALLTWRALRAPLPGPAPFVLSALTLLAVGRVGCFLMGCCFGHRSDAPWAIRYPVGRFAQVLHRELGWVGAEQPSLPVVPVQLLEAVGVLALLALGVWWRRGVRRDGPWALVMVAGYVLLRAALDPLRAMVNFPASVHRLGPASVFQWAALAVALGCLTVAALWWRRPVRAVPPRSTLPNEARGSTAAVLWVLQASVALVSMHEGTLLLRILVASSLAASALWVLGELRLTARKPVAAFAAASLVLLLPGLLLAADGQREERGTRWLYTAVPGSQHLVRLGTTTTAREELARRAWALLAPTPDRGPAVQADAVGGAVPQGCAEGGDGGCDAGCDEGSPGARGCSVALDGDGALPAVEGGLRERPLPPPLDAAALSPGATPSPGSEGERRPLVTVGVVFVGGMQAFTEPGCGSYSAYQGFGLAGAMVEGRFGVGPTHEPHWRWQLRANGILNRSWQFADETNGWFATGGGLVEYHSPTVSVGLGCVLGAGNLGRFSVWSLTPIASRGTLDVQGAVMPLAYLRLEFIKNWAFELGTGSRFQPTPGGFIGFRAGSDEPDRVAVRIGLESDWLPAPLANTNVFTSLAVPLTARDRLVMRVQLGVGAFDSPNLSGGAQYSHTF